MPSVICIHFQSTCRPLCNIDIHLKTLLNILMPRYSWAHLNAKCHEVTLTVKLLIDRSCLHHGPWVVPRPYKICDWMLNSSHDHFTLHQGKNVRVIMEFKVPQRQILRPTLSTNMVQRVLRWERQKRCPGRKRQWPMTKKCNYSDYYYYIIIILFYLEGGDKMMTREWSNLIMVFENCPSQAYINTFIFWCRVIPLGPQSIYT